MNRVVLNNTLMVSGGVVVGAGLGYIFAKKRFRAQAEEEIASVKAQYKLMRKEDEFATPEQAVEALGVSVAKEISDDIYESAVGVAHKKIVDLGYAEEQDEAHVVQTKEETDPEGTALERGESVVLDVDPSQGSEAGTNVTVNIFEASSEAEDVTKWDRDEDLPFVIHADEYFEDEFKHYDKNQLTYFQGDDTLADEREVVIPDIDGIVGRDNLQHFGKGTYNEEHVVYIRNQKREADYEITRDFRSYSEMVAGFGPNQDWDTLRVRGSEKIRKLRNDE